MAQNIFGDREYDSLQNEFNRKMDELKDDRMRIEALQENLRRDIQRLQERADQEIRRYTNSIRQLDRDIERLREKMSRRQKDIMAEAQKNAANSNASSKRTGSYF